jgi:cell division septation protein DedD
VRTLIALALVLVACGRSDRPDDPASHDAAPSRSRASGPDAVVLRIARGGGPARAYAYPRLDSAIWTSTDAAPAPDHVLAFNEESGQVVYVDARGYPTRLDLRSGATTVTRKPKLVNVASSDGAAIYAITDSGSVTRITPTGRWTFKAPLRARDVLPQSDGSILIAGEKNGETVLWHLFPPDNRIIDTIQVPRASKARRIQAGDRVVLVLDSAIAAVRARDLAPVPSAEMKGRIVDVAPTPSGDRLYVALEGNPELRVIDRYREGETGTVTLPGAVSELRMDPLGRYLIARPVKGDSAWVVALGTQRVLGAVATNWRPDLPIVAPDGKLVLTSGSDVRFVDAETLRPAASVRGGAKDFWQFILWDGFRPRNAALDAPVYFETRDTVRDSATVAARAADTAGAPDLSGIGQVPPPPSPGNQAAPPAPTPGGTPNVTTPQRASGFVVSFATLLSEPGARAEASRVVVDGEQARVVTSAVGGRPVYRVVLGPYASRAEADRVGKRAGHAYWIYEGVP